jgi:hypothetical protein
MFFHGGIILCNADKGLGDVNAGVAEERLRKGKRETAGPGRIEQETLSSTSRSANRLSKTPLSSCYIGSSRAIVQVDVAAGQQICRRIERDGLGLLVEGLNLIERGP